MGVGAKKSGICCHCCQDWSHVCAVWAQHRPSQHCSYARWSASECCGIRYSASLYCESGGHSGKGTADDRGRVAQLAAGHRLATNVRRTLDEPNGNMCDQTEFDRMQECDILQSRRQS
ncbi:hypothetical protein ATCV1_z736R [Acanthocystis turfacea chlorella virus 1]|uniref:Uncharacterized protein z736R n=1 Tax=Chlorovirus heliozoae TaxID=322019 RepID=A7K9Z6_9PHYC|nr:hypothetical protein ATCV1_z736R [Acanthocystis turfacea chlorella virus 1]ABT16870.1 hypothetical protein ATCV1_z736R [Acanthocystis turfacea chlorella virus 1]